MQSAPMRPITESVIGQDVTSNVQERHSIWPLGHFLFLTMYGQKAGFLLKVSNLYKPIPALFDQMSFLWKERCVG